MLRGMTIFFSELATSRQRLKCTEKMDTNIEMTSISDVELWTRNTALKDNYKQHVYMKH